MQCKFFWFRSAPYHLSTKLQIAFGECNLFLFYSRFFKDKKKKIH